MRFTCIRVQVWPILPSLEYHFEWIGWPTLEYQYEQVDLRNSSSSLYIWVSVWVGLLGIFFFAEYRPFSWDKSPKQLHILALNSCSVWINWVFWGVCAMFILNHQLTFFSYSGPSWTLSSGKFFMLFCRLIFFSKSPFWKNSFRNTIWVSYRLDTD